MGYRYDAHREFFSSIAYMERKQQDFSSCREQISTEQLEKAMTELQAIIASGELDLNQFGGGKFRAKAMDTAVACMLLIYGIDDALS